jgi:hypothetical protein
MNIFINKEISEEEKSKLLNKYLDYIYVSYSNELKYDDNKYSHIIYGNDSFLKEDKILCLKELMKNELDLYSELVVVVEYGLTYDSNDINIIYLNKDT